MALKDWKKTSSSDEGEPIIIFSDFKVRPTETTRRPTIAVWKDGNEWFVDTPKQTDRKFKNKTDAMKYANDYMRSH